MLEDIKNLVLLVLMAFSFSCRGPSNSNQIQYSQNLFPNLQINLNQSGLDYTTTNDNQLFLSSQIEVANLSISSGRDCDQGVTELMPFRSPLNLFIADDPGFLTFSYRATTATGFPSACITKTFMIDRNPPLLADTSLLMAKPFTNRLDQSPLFYWNQAVDNQVGLGHYLLGVSEQNDPLTVSQWVTVPTVQAIESHQLGQMSLTHGQSYYGFLKAVDQLGNTTLPMASSSWLVDNVLPQFNGDLEFDWFTNLENLPAIRWNAALDLDSGIDNYHYSWGSQPGLQDIIGWRSAANNLAPTNPKFLSHLSSVYPSVRVTDRAGNQIIKSSQQAVLSVREWESKAQNWDIAGGVHLLQADQLGRVLIGGTQVNTISHHRFGLIAMDEVGAPILDKNSTVGFDGQVYVQRNLDGGKMLLAGAFRHYNGQRVPPIIRLNADLSLDVTFQVNFNFAPNDFVYDLDFQGVNIIIVGEFTGRIMRLQANGLVDPTFVVGAGFNGTVSVVRVNPVNSDIFCGGRFFSYKGQPKPWLIRLDSQGNQVAWPSGLTFDSWVTAIAFDAAGSVLVGGRFSTPHSRLVKINLDGTLDNNFNVNVATIDLIDSNGISLAAPVYIDNIQVRNSAIYVAGQFNRIGGHTSPSIAKLNLSGVVDINFAIKQSPSLVTPSTTGSLPRTAMHIEVGSSNAGSIWAVLQFSSELPTLAYFSDKGDRVKPVPSNPDGVSYTTFNYDQISSLVKNGNVLYISGDISFAAEANTKNYLIRASPDGIIDANFKAAQGDGFDAGVLNSLVEYNNEYIICGSFRTYQGSSNSGVIRVNTNSAVAQNIAVPVTSPANAIIECGLQRVGNEDYLLMLIQQGSFSDGRLLHRYSLANNQLDTSFSPVLVDIDNLSQLRIHSDGTFYIMGRTIISGEQQIQKYSTAGSFDASFGKVSTDEWISDFKLESSALTLAGGFSTVTLRQGDPEQITTSPRELFARINHQGVLQPEIVHSLFDGINTFIADLQPMGSEQLFGLGSFLNANTRNLFKFIKLNASGQADPRFNFNEVVRSPESLVNLNFSEKLLVQPDGKIWLTSDQIMHAKNRAARLIRIAPKN